MVVSLRGVLLVCCAERRMLIYFQNGYKADRIFFVSIANGVLFEFEARQIVSEFLSNHAIVIRAPQQSQCKECRLKKKKDIKGIIALL